MLNETEYDTNNRLARETFGSRREILRTEVAMNGEIIIHSYDSDGEYESRQVNLTLIETMDLVENLQSRIKKQIDSLQEVHHIEQ